MPDKYRIEGSVSLTPEDEEEEKRTPGRPNAWWAQHRQDVKDAGDAAATYDSAVRGVDQGPHGGASSVRPEDVTGSIDYCWCGLPFDHDWPGKDRGRKHPRELSNVAQTSSERQRIERRQLRAYHDDLVDVITEAVNGYGARYRMQKNGIVLFPPDGTQGITVAARNSPRALKSLRIWFLRHCVGVDAQGENPLVADPGVLDEDAERRHERVKAEEEQEIRQDVQQMKEGNPARPASSVTEPEATREEWVPYVTTGGETSEFFETDGTHYRCKVCMGTENEYISDNPRGIGGHVRMNHRETENLHSPEAREKATESKRLNKLTGKVEEAVALLSGAIGQDKRATDREIRELREQLAAVTKRAEEAETRLALMREALAV